MAAFAIFLSTYLWSLVVSQDEPCVAEQCCFNGGSKDVATMVQLHVVQSGNASAQRDPCPQGFSDFSYNFTGLGGQFPSGVAFTTPPNVEIAPNLELVSFSSTTDSNPAIWKSLSPSWKSLVLQGSCTTVNDPFIQLGDWRLATYDFDTLSITHRDGKTATYYKSGGSYHDGPHNTFNGYHCAGPPSGKLKAGDHFLQLGSWRIGASDDQHLSISHSQGQTAMIFRGFDATLHPGPRTDHNLWSKPTLTTPIGVTFGDGFAQIGKFRLGEFDSTHFSVSHEGGKTVQMFKDDGNTVHGPGPAEGFNFSTFGRPEYQDLQTCSNSRETEYCHILGVLKISPSGGEIDCDPGLGNSARIGLRFTESIRLISLNFWGVQSSDDLTVTLGTLGVELAAKSEGNLQTATAQPMEVSEVKDAAEPAKMNAENIDAKTNGNGNDVINVTQADKAVRTDQTESTDASQNNDKSGNGKDIGQPGTNKSKEHDCGQGGDGSGASSSPVPAAFKKNTQKKPDGDKFVMQCKIPYLTIKSADELPKKFRKVLMAVKKKRKTDPKDNIAILTRPPFLSKKEIKRLTLAAPEPASLGGKAFDKILKRDDGEKDASTKKNSGLLDSSVAGKDASHLLN